MITAAAWACRQEPLPSHSDKIEKYDVIGQTFDPASESLTVAVRVNPYVSEAAVRSLAESLIDERKDGFKNVIVRTHVWGSGPDDLPYGVSALQDGVVTHRFDKRALPQRIPTH